MEMNYDMQGVKKLANLADATFIEGIIKAASVAIRLRLVGKCWSKDLCDIKREIGNFDARTKKWKDRND